LRFEGNLRVDTAVCIKKPFSRCGGFLPPGQGFSYLKNFEEEGAGSFLSAGAWMGFAVRGKFEMQTFRICSKNWRGHI
jgi:hypothetical protein